MWTWIKNRHAGQFVEQAGDRFARQVGDRPAVLLSSLILPLERGKEYVTCVNEYGAVLDAAEFKFKKAIATGVVVLRCSLYGMRKGRTHHDRCRYNHLLWFYMVAVLSAAYHSKKHV